MRHGRRRRGLPHAGALGLLGLRLRTAEPDRRLAGRALRSRGAPLDRRGADQPPALGALQAGVHRDAGGLPGGAGVLPPRLGPRGRPAGADAPRDRVDHQAARPRDCVHAPPSGGCPHHRGRRALAPPRHTGRLRRRAAAGHLVLPSRLPARADPRLPGPVTGSARHRLERDSGQDHHRLRTAVGQGALRGDPDPPRLLAGAPHRLRVRRLRRIVGVPRGSCAADRVRPARASRLRGRGDRAGHARQPARHRGHRAPRQPGADQPGHGHGASCRWWVSPFPSSATAARPS